MISRRVIFGVIAAAGILILVLGVLGVFSKTSPLSLPDPVPGTETTSAQAVLKNFSVEGEGWRLTAEEATIDVDYRTRLKNPQLRLIRQTPEGEEIVELSADMGDYIKELPARVDMTGNVRATYAGREKAEFSAPQLTVMPDERAGRTDSLVRLVMTSEEGRQELSGRGGEFILGDRIVRLNSEVRMQLKGGSPLLDGEKSDSTAKSAPIDTIVVCSGPCVADGFTHTVILENDVVLKQGHNELNARRLEVCFGKDMKSPERLIAEGNVTFKMSGVEGSCDKMTRVSVEELVVLAGNPVILRQGASDVQSSKIELNLKTGSIEAFDAGRLQFVNDKSNVPSEAMSVSWSNSMRFSRSEKRAVFRGQVCFVSGSQTVNSNSLSVRFDDEMAQLLECRAEGNVHVSSVMKQEQDTQPTRINASSREMKYNPKDERLVFSGNAIVVYGDQTVCAEKEIEFHPADSSIKVTGPGSLDATQPDREDGERVSVAWTGGMQFTRANGIAEFQRQVTLLYGNKKLSCDTCSAKLGTDNQLEEFVAEGNAIFEEPGEQPNSLRKLHADRMRTQVGSDRSLKNLDASGSVMVEEGGHVATGDKLLWDMGRNVGTLRGMPAILRQGPQEMLGEEIEFQKEPERVRVSGMRRVEAKLRINEPLDLPVSR